VAEAYIAHCRKVGRWVHNHNENAYSAIGEEAYRDRLKDYRRALVWSIKQRRAGK